MRTYRTAVVAVLLILLVGPTALAIAAEKHSPRSRAGTYQQRPALALPAGMKLNVIVKLRIEGDPIGNWLADRLQRTEGYCPGDNGDFRLPWQLFQEILAHLSAPSRLDADYPQARWDREQFVIELKAIQLCRAGA